MNIEKLLDELYSYSMHGIKLGLENIQKICKELGSPEKSYKIVHIAGTNGKGSTATTLETILLEAGYKVGKYTSPHILKFNERIRMDGVDISDAEIAYYYDEVKKAIERAGVKPTFFEVTTAMMFKYFADKKADYVVLETGMGGRFDATNVVDADLCIITNVTLDHTEYLGDTIYKIAKEKAGIIKDTLKVIVADSDPEFLKAIYEENAHVVNVLEKYANTKWSLDFDKFITKIVIGDEEYDFSLFGEYQVKNFLCAFEASVELGIDKEIIKRACTKTVWQCRFERWDTNPLVILDGAHNPDGMTELKKVVQKGFKAEDVVAIVSILKDKDRKQILEILRPVTSNIIFTSLEENSRGTSGDELYELIEDKSGCCVENDIVKAFKMAKDMNKKVILICGSFYLLSKFKEEIKK